jgi:hypothetical protein
VREELGRVWFGLGVWVRVWVRVGGRVEGRLEVRAQARVRGGARTRRLVRQDVELVVDPKRPRRLLSLAVAAVATAVAAAAAAAVALVRVALVRVAVALWPLPRLGREATHLVRVRVGVRGRSGVRGGVKGWG